MAIVVVLLIIAAIVGAVIWNHQNANKAIAGVSFAVPQSVGEVAAAIEATYCIGAKAKLKSGMLGVRVAPTGPASFNYGTKLGDVGDIRIEATPGQTIVTAATSKLHVGSGVKMRPRSPLFALSYAITRSIARMLGITPGAVKMKRFQNRLENNVARRVADPASRI
jgi:hypothetical protein